MRAARGSYRLFLISVAVALLLTGWFFVNRFSERWLHA